MAETFVSIWNGSVYAKYIGNMPFSNVDQYTYCYVYIIKTNTYYAYFNKIYYLPKYQLIEIIDLNIINELIKICIFK